MGNISCLRGVYVVCATHSVLVFATFHRKPREKLPIMVTSPMSEYFRMGSVKNGTGIPEVEPGISCHSRWRKPSKWQESCQMGSGTRSHGLPLAKARQFEHR